MSQVQTMAGCQPGTLRPKASGQKILFPYLHVQIKPLPGTCVNSNLSQQFLQECKQKGRKCNRTESWLGFTALAGSWLCFSVYLHNSSAYNSPSRSRSEFFCLLSHSWIIVGSVTGGCYRLYWDKNVIYKHSQKLSHGNYSLGQGVTEFLYSLVSLLCSGLIWKVLMVLRWQYFLIIVK